MTNLRVFGIEETEEGTWIITHQNTDTILDEEDTFGEAIDWLAANHLTLNALKEHGN